MRPLPRSAFPPQSPKLCRILLITGAWVMLAISSIHGQDRVRLDVDLNELRGKAFMEFLRAVVPEVYGGEARVPVDLPTLQRLHTRLVSDAMHLPREEKVAARYSQRALESLMRGRLAALDLPALRQLALGDGKQGYGNPGLVDALCHRWIEQEVATIMAEPKRKLDFPAEPTPLPEYLKRGGGAERDGREYDRAVGPFAKVLAELRDQKPRGIHEEGADFGGMAREFLLNPDQKVVQELLRFTWDSWCGTGAFEFEQRKMTLVFMGLLRERRIAEALGVSFFVPAAPGWMRVPGRPYDAWRIELLKSCGFDWEAAMLGSANIELLAAAGSERAARAGVAVMKQSAKPWEQTGTWPWSLKSLSRFLAPGQPGYDDAGDPRKAISAQTQKDIFAVIDGATRFDVPFFRLDQVVSVHEDLCRPETKETLRRLLKHPSTTFAGRAADLLRRLGEDVAAIAPAPPVRFRLFLNGEPWRASDVSYWMTDPARGSVRLGGGSIKTDGEGFAAIPRDAMLDPAHAGTHLKFLQYPQGGTVWTERLYDQPWIETEIARPAAYDEVTVVHFAAARVPIEISYAQASRAPRKARVQLMKAGHSPNDWSFSLSFEDARVPAPEKFAFGVIGPGNYQLMVFSPGSARHTTEPFEVKPGMEPVKVKLEKGYDLYFALYAPANARGVGEIQLLRGDRDITTDYPPPYWDDAAKPVFSGLPKGSYQLRVLSTQEFMKKHDIREWKPPEVVGHRDLRDGVDCESLIHAFTIDDAGPAVLDLGRLNIQPMDVMRHKAAPAALIRGGSPSDRAAFPRGPLNPL